MRGQDYARRPKVPNTDWQKSVHIVFFKLRGTVARINCHLFMIKEALFRRLPSYYLRNMSLFHHTLANKMAVHPVAMETDQYPNLTMINLFLVINQYPACLKIILEIYKAIFQKKYQIIAFLGCIGPPLHIKKTP